MVSISLNKILLHKIMGIHVRKEYNNQKRTNAPELQKFPNKIEYIPETKQKEQLEDANLKNY